MVHREPLRSKPGMLGTVAEPDDNPLRAVALSSALDAVRSSVGAWVDPRNVNARGGATNAATSITRTGHLFTHRRRPTEIRSTGEP